MAALVAPRVGRGELDEARTVAGGVLIAGLVFFVLAGVTAFALRGEAMTLLGATGRDAGAAGRAVHLAARVRTRAPERDRRTVHSTSSIEHDEDGIHLDHALWKARVD